MCYFSLYCEHIHHQEKTPPSTALSSPSQTYVTFGVNGLIKWWTAVIHLRVLSAEATVHSGLQSGLCSGLWTFVMRTISPSLAVPNGAHINKLFGTIQADQVNISASDHVYILLNKALGHSGCLHKKQINVRSQQIQSWTSVNISRLWKCVFNFILQKQRTGKALLVIYFFLNNSQYTDNNILRFPLSYLCNVI